MGVKGATLQRWRGSLSLLVRGRKHGKQKKIRILLWGEPEQAVLNDMVSIRTQDRLPRNMGVFNDVYTKFNDPFCFSLSRLSGSLTKLFRDDILLVSANSFVDSLCLDSICFAMLKFFLS